MRSTAPCTLLLITSALAPMAHAQSSLQVSGILDLALRQVSHQGAPTVISTVSGSNSTSRLAFTGRESLGSGASASFHLEHGLLANAGTAASTSKFWDRRSTVSLSHTAAGELRLGRDFVPSYSNWSRYDPFAYVGVARTANLVSATPNGPIRSAFGTNANTTVRADNAAQWLFPAGWGGIEGGVMFAPGEGGAVASGKARVIGLRVGYAAAQWGVSAATTISRNSQTVTSDFKDTAFGAHATLGPVRLSAAVRQFSLDAARQRLTLIGASTTHGAHEFKASWTRADMKGRVGTTSIAADDADQFGLGYVYNLSNRSALYGSVAWISNDGAARFLISDGATGLVAGGRSRGVEAGIRHRF